jgi:hypothetical protein
MDLATLTERIADILEDKMGGTIGVHKQTFFIYSPTISHSSFIAL